MPRDAKDDSLNEFPYLGAWFWVLKLKYKEGLEAGINCTQKRRVFQRVAIDDGERLCALMPLSQQKNIGVFCC